MISFAGSIMGDLKYPYIYAITVGHCLYIGETQRHPASRWGEHFSQGGTFLRKITESNEKALLLNNKILCISLACDKIKSLSQEEQKLVTQFVEHQVHIQCILNRQELMPIEKVLSDTTRTAPLFCRHPWAMDLAKEVFKELVFLLSRNRNL